MTENHDLEALASNPHTDWDVLHWIAENHPELRPVIAANPGAYQELVDALAAMGNPQIDAAIAEREAAGGVTTGPATDQIFVSPMDGLWDNTGYTLAAQQAAAYEAETQAEAESAAEPPADAQPDTALEPDAPHESVAVPVPDAAPEFADELEFEEEPAPEFAEEPYAEFPEEPAADAPAPQSAAMPAFLAAAPPENAEPKRSRRGLPLLAIATAVLGIGAVGAAIGLMVLIFGADDDEETVAEPPAATDPAAEDEDDDAAEESADQNGDEDGTEEEDAATEGEGDEVDEEALDEARTEVAGLSEEPSCETDTDASVVASFLTVAANDDDWASDDDPDMLESTFGSLQSECSPSHAAGVFEAARSGAQAPEGGHGEMLSTVGTDWVDREIDLRGAEQMSGFSAQDGNVECEFGDGVTCTVYETDPALCDDGTTYTMTVDGVDVDCDAQLEPGGRETLSVDDNATDGFLVCMEMSDRVTCYNSIDPFGFEMSNIGNYTY